MKTEIHGSAWAFRALMALAQKDIDDDGEIKPARRIYAEADARVRLRRDQSALEEFRLRQQAPERRVR